MIQLIGVSMSEPHTSESSTHFHVVDHTQTTTEKNGKLTSTSMYVSCSQPCHGEINNVDYNTSIFVSCSQLYHGEINSVDYSTSNSRHKIHECSGGADSFRSYCGDSTQ